MIRHPHYLEVPWDVHWQGAAPGSHQRHLWWLIAVLVIIAMFMVGVGTLGGNV